jgi:hypothetical protein
MVHFVVLTVGQQMVGADSSFAQLFSFKWPSVAYALDIVAWDIFFAVSMLSAAFVFRGRKLNSLIRSLMVMSGLVALAGLSGVVSGDMRLRSIGIAGYALVFPLVAGLVGTLFYRTQPTDDLQPASVSSS